MAARRLPAWLLPWLGVLLASACVDLTRPPGLAVCEGAACPDAAPAPRPPDAVAPRPGADAADAPASASAPADAPAASPDTAPRPTPGLIDAGPSPGAGAANGAPCSAPAACASGFCADGVCCATACTGACESCNQPGAAGACTAVPAGEDPDDDCPADPPTSCARDGQCDGRRGCRFHAAGVVCAPGTCVAGEEASARTCDGLGACRPAQTKSCAPYTCAGAVCAQTCGPSAGCVAGSFCDRDGKCSGRQPNGATCTGPTQCHSGFCVDGVCCQTACQGTCQACNLTPSPGTCLPVPAGMDPREQCAAEAASSCGRDGACDGNGRCRLHAAGTVCAPAACSQGTQTTARTCNGTGTCIAATPTACAPYVCAGTACATSCTGDAGCAAGRSCSAGVCVPSGLVLHWRFDEDAGATALDSSGNGHHGTYTGSTGTPTPSAERAPLMFDNPRSRAFELAPRHTVVLTNMPAALKPANDLTVSVWYRATRLDSGGSELLSAGNSYMLRLVGGGLELIRRHPGGWHKCTASLSGHLDGRWHHVAGVLTAAGMFAYFDGNLRCTNNLGPALSYDLGNAFHAGRHGSGEDPYDFEGNLDDLRVYGRALGAPEIVSIAGGAPP